MPGWWLASGDQRIRGVFATMRYTDLQITIYLTLGAYFYLVVYKITNLAGSLATRTALTQATRKAPGACRYVERTSTHWRCDHLDLLDIL